jgi:glucokinase
MSITLALDVGGTHMRAAVFPENERKPIHQTRIRTYADGETSLERLIHLIREITPVDETIQAIGIAVPGPIDPHLGVILTAPNLPEWVGVPLPKLIENEIGAPVYLGNDANLAAVGEWRYGAGLGHHNLVYLTISTGIGGGVICNDHLLLGYQGLGAELGHVTILPGGPLCSCGQRGHLEAISSGTGIAAYVAEQLAVGRESILQDNPNTKAISQAAIKGDKLAIEAFERAGYYLGLAVANYLMIFNPSIVIFGGGVSQTGDLLLDPVRKVVRESVLSEHYLQDLVLTQAALGDDAGLYGALALARGALPTSSPIPKP